MTTRTTAAGPSSNHNHRGDGNSGPDALLRGRRWRRTAAAAAPVLLALAGLLWGGGARADDRKSTSELIRARGFNVDEFDVISQNYPLKVYHLINPLADPRALHHTPVVTAHGINFNSQNMMSSSANARPRRPRLDERVTLYALENGTDDRGLHFYLSNNNYDVWLIEHRATSPRVLRRLAVGARDKAFWDFSLDEQALMDLPKQIEFVLQKTGARKAAYIGYSQSTALMFALLAMRPDFSERLACFVALAPVVYTSHLRGLIWPLTPTGIYLFPSSAIPNFPEWLRRSGNFVVSYLCSISFIKYSLCRKVWEQFAGRERRALLEAGMTEDVIKSTSLKTFEQFISNSKLHDFRMFDYKDELRNLEEYGQVVPPIYNISKINLRTIALFRGAEDILSDPEDQMILLSRLRVPLYEDHILEDYGHLAFITSPTVTRDVNEPILRILDRTTNRTVHRVSHTLGNPNPQVAGTPLVMDAKQDESTTRDQVRSFASGYGSTSAARLGAQAQAERPRAQDGVDERPATDSVRDQLFGEQTGDLRPGSGRVSS